MDSRGISESVRASIDYPSISRDLRYYLAYFGWSKAELARRINVHPDTVSRWKETPTAVILWLDVLHDLHELKRELRKLGGSDAEN